MDDLGPASPEAATDRMDDLGQASSPEATTDRQPNAIAIAAGNGVRRLVAWRPNPFSVLERVQPSDLALVVALAAIGLAVRLVVLDVDNIHADEALYASYSLHIAQTGDWNLVHIGSQIVKIPVFFWAQAIVISWLGDTPLSIRLVDLAASLATIGAVYLLARDLSGRVAGWAAGLAMAISPFAILFGASVFLDPFSTALGFGALALARRNHACSAGILAGLALGGQLMGVAFMPVALVLLLTVDAPRRRTALAAFLVAFGIVAGALFGYMYWRAQNYGLPWFLSVQSEGVAGGTGLASQAEWNSRLSGWWTTLGYFAESNPLRLIAAVGLAGALLAVIRNRGRLRWAIAAVCAFSVAYFGFLVVVRSPLYDRYLFYILPTLCVAVGVGIGEFLRLVRWPGVRRALILACTVFVLARSVPIIALAQSGTYWVGPRSDVNNTGYRQMCSWLQGHASVPTVVWYQSMSWPLGYCMSGYPGYFYWYSDPSHINPLGPREYVALSQRDDPEGTVAELRARGLTVALVMTADVGGAPHLWIYHVLAPASTAPTP